MMFDNGKPGRTAGSERGFAVGAGPFPFRAPERPTGFDERAVLARIAHIDRGLSELRREAEEIDELLGPLPFSGAGFRGGRDDDGPWAA